MENGSVRNPSAAFFECKKSTLIAWKKLLQVSLFLPLNSRQEPRSGLNLAWYIWCEPEECATLKILPQILMMTIVFINGLFIVFSQVMGGVLLEVLKLKIILKLKLKSEVF